MRNLQKYTFVFATAAIVWQTYPLQTIDLLRTSSIGWAQSQQDVRSQAVILYQQGLEQFEASQYTQALSSFQQALSVFQEISEPYAESTILSMVAAIYIEQGNHTEVPQVAELALSLAEEAQDIPLQIQILTNLGITYKATGQYLEAARVYSQTLAKVRSLPENQRWQEAQILDLLGNVYSALGDYTKATSAYHEGLSLARRRGDVSTEVSVLGNLGTVHVKLAQNDAALDSFQLSLQIAQTINDIKGIAYALSNIGSIYQNRGLTEQVLENYQQGLDIARAENMIELEANMLNSLGLFYEDSENYEQAIAYYEESLAKAQSINNPQSAAMAMNNLGHSLFGAGRLAEAEIRLRAAIDNLESLRPKLTDNYNISLFDTQISTYNLLQQILVAQNKNEAALEISERGRAQAFVDLLAQRTTPSRVDNIASLERQPLSIEKIKAIAREQNATLVEYALVPDDDFKFQGRQRGQAAEIFIWVVKPDGEVILIHKDLADLLPEGTSFEQLVASTRKSVIGGKANRNRNAEQSCHSSSLCLGDIVRRNDVDNERYEYEIVKIDVNTEDVTLQHPDFSYQPVVPISQVSIVEDPETQQNQLNELYQVLIAPIEALDLLPKNPEERIIFVPQEQLFLVPFPALRDSAGNYLIENHTISTIPSIQVLETTRQRRLEIADKGGDALIVGNPSPMPTLPTDEKALPALNNSEDEANDIAQLLNTNALVKSAATETAVKQRLSDARLIHLATHGLFQEEGDPLQSSLALAPGSEDSDGFLTAEEILDYSLQADLVVLSACDTGRGSITGDGVIGLSRSFIAAGTPSVIVSLWQVPDEATSNLMIKFYENRHTLDKAQSLRQAMLHMIEQKLKPEDWAAFMLIGEAE